MISRFKRWLRDRRTPPARVLTPWEMLLLDGGRRYRDARPWICGVVGRRDHD
jgi:hypothetical protein